MTLTPAQTAFEAALKSGAASGVSPVFMHRLEWSAAVERKQEAAYRSFLRETGFVAATADFIASTEKEQKMLALSHEIAGRMERLGLGGYRQGTDQLWLFGAHSGQVQLFPNFRRNNFIPHSAHAKRNTTLRELEYFLQKHGKSCRMAVVNGGTHGKGRVQSLYVCDQWDWQNRKIREWNKSPVARRFGIEVVFRSNELGSPCRKRAQKERTAKGRWERPYMRDKNGQRIRNLDDHGRQTYHPHTHFIYRMSRYLPAPEWAAMIEAMQHHFEQVMPDHGAIADAREACKYVMKSDEILLLRDMDFIRIYRRIHGRHTVQPMGSLKLQKSRHEQGLLKLRRVRSGTEDEGFALKPVLNWNRKPLGFQKGEIKPMSEPTRETTLCARLAPMPRFSPVAEPLFIFRGRVDLRAAYRSGHVQAALAATREAYEAGEQLFEALHGVKPLDWAIADAPLLAASRKVSAHTSPVTGNDTEKSRARSKAGGSPSFGAAPQEPKSRARAEKSQNFAQRGHGKAPSPKQTGALPLLGRPSTHKP